MDYTSTELSELTGFNLSQICSYLHNAGFSPVGIVGKNQNVWQEECLDFLLKKKHSMDMKDTIILTSLSAAFDLSCDYIRDVLSSKGIEPVEITMNNTTGNKIERYPIEVKEIMIEHVESLKVDKEDEHPLVTDKRWLKLSNWPNTVPKCFEDLEEA